MWPTARKGRPILHKDDIDGIRSLYGKNVSVIINNYSPKGKKILANIYRAEGEVNIRQYLLNLTRIIFFSTILR